MTSTQRTYPCTNCGATLMFAPGTDALVCPYCGSSQHIRIAEDRVVREHSWDDFARLPRKPIATLGAHVFKCPGCGAVTETNQLSDRCQFCGAAVVATADTGEMVVPEAVLPFALDRPAVRDVLQKWVSSRWFAPTSLKKVANAEQVKSTYLPHWTYDAATRSSYTGQRGEHYYETETYTTLVDGEQRTETRQVQRTAWYPASGNVARDFDDVLVRGTDRIAPKHLDTLEPWPLPESKPFDPDYLAGHDTLRYDVEPEQGMNEAKGRMASAIENDCRQDIGGDEQRVDYVDTSYANVMFKLMLLPVWICVYLHGGKSYQVLVNGRTGEVAGERPYSKLKITLLVLAIILVLAIVGGLYLASKN
jgi:DNA-directed RNA polymerase subunit RPC12/RpoP